MLESTGIWQGRPARILKSAASVMFGEAARQRGDLLRQNADLHLLPLGVAARLCRRGRLAGGEQARERRKDTLRDVVRLDFAAPLWLLQGTEVILMQSTVQRDVAHVRHGETVRN